MGPLGSTGAALPGVAGALLTPGLSAAAGDFGAGEGALGTLSAVGEVVLDNLVHDGLVGLDAEDRVVQFHSADFCAGHVQHFHSRH